jgi:hypothetical protein
LSVQQHHAKNERPRPEVSTMIVCPICDETFSAAGAVVKCPACGARCQGDGATTEPATRPREEPAYYNDAARAAEMLLRVSSLTSLLLGLGSVGVAVYALTTSNLAGVVAGMVGLAAAVLASAWARLVYGLALVIVDAARWICRMASKER